MTTRPDERCPIHVFRPHSFRSQRAWDALDIARLDDATVRLHWTDKPYVWHVNDGVEVFAVLDGEVEMLVRVAGEVERIHLRTGDVFRADTGDEHVAHPIGEARILVIERAGSI